MSAAAVASRSTQRNSSLTPSRMANNSSADNKKSLLKHDDAGKKASPVKASTDSSKSSSTATDSGKKDKTESSNATTKPLAPPPRPGQASSSTDSPDYFSALHNNTTAFALEPNPFEQSFGSSSDTPGKSLLPPVAALTSPSSLLAGGPNSTGYSWSNSLRAGPLSPAMLTGPTGANDIFDAHFKSFPTPNESSLRTGLTPGGGGSMFPMSSPNPLFGSLTSGGATPGTLDFHRTAMSAAAAASRSKESTNIPATSVPSTFELTSSLDQPTSTATAGPTQANGKNVNELFGHGDANDAANGLFMLAQARSNNGRGNTAGSDDKSALKGAGSADASGSDSGKSEAKPVTRSRGKKPTAKKAAATTAVAPPAPTPTATRRKADSTPAGKSPAAKKAKASMMDDDDDDDDMDMDMDDDDMQASATSNKDTRKMTDEEKRKNFLERNRVAALKCRQRKKQWLANLQSKVELYSTENDALNAQVASLRQEVMNLKTLLLAHKDCPVTQSQGLTAMNMGPMGGDFSQHPYNIAMANRAPVMAGQNVQRRFS